MPETSLTASVIARLTAEVPDLRSAEGAASFAALVARNAAPANTPAAHVLLGTVRGGAADAMTGVFTQGVTEGISIILSLRPNDRLGARAIEPVEGLKNDVIAAIAGWAPGDEVGVFALVSGAPVSFAAGLLVYRLDFAIADQLRIFE
jgi:hypothetical protein